MNRRGFLISSGAALIVATSPILNGNIFMVKPRGAMKFYVD